MRCAVNRWGPGTTKDKPCVTEAMKEMEARMAKLKEEREKQDKMWTAQDEAAKETNGKK